MDREKTDIELWKKSLFRLPENIFLNIIRTYVGVIKTPYNKERLVNDLVSFLYKEDHKNAIVTLLTEKDILFLSAVYYLESPTNELLLSFFEGEYTAFYLYDYIANLEERLLLYRNYDENSKKEYLDINPLLQEKLKNSIRLSNLLPLPQRDVAFTGENKNPALCCTLFGAWYAFIAQNPDACRADGSFKKKILSILDTVFYGVEHEFLMTLNTAFINLGLFFHDGSNVCLNEKKWAAFSELSNEVQKLYVCIASFRRFSRDQLIKHTNFAKRIVENIPNEGLTQKTIIRLGYILKNTQKNEQKTGFFAKVLQRAQNISTDEETFTDKALIEKLAYFGLLTISGKDIEGNHIYTANRENPVSEKAAENNTDASSPFISINAGFSVTFIIKVDLSIMLPLVSCMKLESYDTVCRFEITRSSCMYSFDKGETSESLLVKLEKASTVPLSQNLVFSIKEWYETYNSASLYHGYVLQVAEEKIIQIENNASLAPRIKKKLAPGIYIFDFETKDEMISAIEKSSLDFIGLPKNAIKEPDVLPFGDLINGKLIPLDYSENTAIERAPSSNHIRAMKKELESLSLPIEQKEGLLERIERKLVLTPKQLIGETIRSEKTEASGIDFMGKVQVIEQAIAASNMIEISMVSGIYSGRPIKIEKKDGDASVILTQEDTKTITFLIGQARSVKRFRQPLY